MRTVWDLAASVRSEEVSATELVEEARQAIDDRDGALNAFLFVSAAGLPLGLQIMGRRHADDVVLRLMRILEEVRPWSPAPSGRSGAN